MPCPWQECSINKGIQMRIFVCIKQVPDTETRIKLKPDNSDIDANGVKWIVNPYDEFAIEEAVKIKEANQGATVTVVSVGPKARLTNSLRTAMAMGCDDGILIDEASPLDSLTTAKAMAKAIQHFSMESPIPLKKWLLVSKNR